MPRVPGCCAKALPAVATTSMAARNKHFDRILTSWLGSNVTSGERTSLRRRPRSGNERGLGPELQVDQRVDDRLDLGEPRGHPRVHILRHLVGVLLENRKPG